MYRKHLYVAVFLLAPGLGCAIGAQAYDIVEKEADGSTHVRIPFIRVDVDHPGTPGKHVHVKAPFINVDNPAGEDNVQVKAPWTRVKRDPTTGNTNVRAPFIKMDNAPPKDSIADRNTIDAQANGTSAKAPQTDAITGGVSPKAPLVKVQSAKSKYVKPTALTKKGTSQSATSGN